ncbi:DNRLRE domain-containing protein [Actinoplanes sp. KI2]|uniref:DNRLRE domain-containing protein n=1 Tax=Actinoplanes sp. KI2 TaxID=2983315 RepID=UPI0021D59550|nr:DNRLRE domain-containing protein [Actinoplanes sp. KI2]MCU7724009.1 DNRLRE domain-containing protein [Actinoplanes sp. KI2]
MVVGPPEVAMAAPSAVAQARLEAPDEASAMRLAHRKRLPVLVTSQTSETTQVWAQPDGQFRMTLYSAPERMRDAAGEWIAVDLTLERKDDGSIGPKAHPRGLKLSGKRSTDSDSLVELGVGADTVSVGWRGALPAPKLDGATATYTDVQAGVDLVVQARPTGFEYSLVVKDKAALAKVGKVSMPWSGAAVTSASANGLQARSALGSSVSLPAAEMWDARRSTKTGDPAFRAPVGVTTELNGSGGSDLVLTPDRAFLDDPGLTFPVTIDPAVDLNPVYDAFIQNTYNTNQSASTELKLGYSDDSGDSCGSGCVARSLLRFQQPAALENASVGTATLHLYNSHSWSCTAMQWESWRVSNADTSNTWANQPSWIERAGLSTQTKGYSGCSAGGVEISVKPIFQYVADTSSETMAKIGLKASSEGNHNSWKKFNSSEAASSRPYVELTYNHKPNVPTALAIDSCYTACSSPATVSSGTPTIKATFTDPDSSTMRAEFEVYNSAHTVSWGKSGTTVTGVTSGSTRSWKIVPPSGYSKLPDAAYAYRVRGCETWNGAALCGDWSGWFAFTVNTAMPTLPTVTGTPYTERSTGVWNGGPGIQGDFTFGPNAATSVLEYVYQLNDGDAVTVPAGVKGSEMLTANQQTVSTNTTGFVGGDSSVISRNATMGHLAAGSLQVAPAATAGTDAGNQGDTFGSLGVDDYSGLAVGMLGGHRYTVSGWIYVPASTGLATIGTYGASRGLRIMGFARVGTGSYLTYSSNKASVTNGWQWLSMTMSVPTGATEAFVRLYNGFSAGQTSKVVYWDDLSLKEVTGTTTVAGITPTVEGPNTLAVQSRTTSGLTSDKRYYEFLVRPAAGAENYWSLDQRTDPAPSEPDNNYPLKMSTQGASWSETGKAGASALTLDGTGDLSSAGPVLETTNAAGFSVAVWARLDPDKPITGTHAVLSQAGTNTDAFRIELRDDVLDLDGDGTKDPSWCFSLQPTDSTSATTRQSVCTTDFVIPGDWVHLGAVYDQAAGTMTLYVNGGSILGGSEVQQAYASAMWAANGVFTVGRAWQGANVDRFAGELDEVYTKQRALNAREMALWASQL